MTTPALPPIEISILALSVLLLLLHILLHAMLSTGERGLSWNAGARDAPSPPPGRLTGRAGRALENFKETYPAFVAASLAVVVAERAGAWSAYGALLWFSARIVYLPLYLLGVPYLRSLAWLASMAGILAILAELL